LKLPEPSSPKFVLETWWESLPSVVDNTVLETGIRQAATVLLESAIRIAPPKAREWGLAMRGELDQVESPWAGTMWALGGTSVMVKQSLISLVTPSGIVADGGLFAKSPTLRRAATALSGACVLAALLFFASPPFRQAFDVAIKPWLSIVHATSTDPQAAFTAIAQKAQAWNDAEGLALCAVRIQDPKRSASLAKAAVSLDPKLLWIYAPIAMRAPGNPNIAEALKSLQRVDAQNSLFPILDAEAVAQKIRREQPLSPHDPLLQDAWRKQMAMAFESSKFDDYSDRVAQLNRTVLPRYGFNDPYEVETREGDPPQFLLENTKGYAETLLAEGDQHDAPGGRLASLDAYWAVARFGQMLDSQAQTAFEHSIGTSLQSLAYRRLQKSAALEGDQERAALFGYLAEKFDGVGGVGADTAKEPEFGRETALRNAAVVEVSGLMIALFTIFAAIAGTILAFASRRKSGEAQRAKPVAVMVLLTSALGVFFSSVTLYLTYRPYWYIFQTALASGKGVQTRDLQELLNFTQVLPGVSQRLTTLLATLAYSGSPGLLFYVWAGVILFAVIGLSLILLRHFLGQTRAGPPPSRRP
jgi:hypothetical protein